MSLLDSPIPLSALMPSSHTSAGAGNRVVTEPALSIFIMLYPEHLFTVAFSIVMPYMLPLLSDVMLPMLLASGL
jgi:hypothetical protein